MIAVSFVGALPAWKDPSTPAEKLHKLWKMKTRDGVRKYPGVLQNPNIAIEDLEDGAREYPEIVEMNPVMPLLFLRHPTAYEKIQGDIITGWLNDYLERLPERAKRHLAVVFAERVYPIIKDPSHQKMARKALDLAAEVAAGEASQTEAMWKAAKAIRSERVSGSAFGLDFYPLQVAEGAAGLLEPVTIENYVRESTDYTALHWICWQARVAVTEVAEFNAGLVAKQPANWDTMTSKEFYEIREENIQATRAAVQAADKAEMDWQIDQVKAYRAQLLRDEEKASKRHTKLRPLGPVATQEDAEKEAQIQAAIKQAQAGSAQIRAIMSGGNTVDWPVWLGLGLIAAGTTAALLLGPEILAGAALGQGLAELGVIELTSAEISAAASEAAAETISISVNTGIKIVSLGEVEAAATAGEEISAQEAEFLAELIAKLKEAGVEVVSAVAETVVRMPK